MAKHKISTEGYVGTVWAICCDCGENIFGQDSTEALTLWLDHVKGLS